MTAPLPHRPSIDSRAALFSALLPGLGQFVQHRYWQGLTYLTITLALTAASGGLGQISGRAAEVFFFMLLVLPWWAVQSYDAYLGPSNQPVDLLRTWHAVWQQGHDIRFLGVLFLLSAVNDAIIILNNPEYLLPFFCTKPAGFVGGVTKAISPVLHTAVGYGFLRLSPLSLFLYLLNAADRMTNAVLNLTCFIPARVRYTMLISLAGFTT